MKVRIGVGEKAGGDRDCDLAGEPLVAQHRLDERSSCAAVAIGEGVDGLELGVRYRDLGESVGRLVRRVKSSRSAIVSRTRVW